LILHMIQRIGKRVIEDEVGFARILQKEHQAKTAAGPSKKKSEYNKAKSRFSELDELIRGLYENYVSGILPERQYRSLIAQYDVEQTKLDKRIKELSEELKEEKEKPVRIDRFIEVIKRYKEPKELTEEMLRDLVNKVYIYQATGKGKKREQKIEIEFNFIGLFDLAQTTKEKVEVAKAKKSQEEEKALIKKAKARERGQAYRDKKKAERLAEKSISFSVGDTVEWMEQIDMTADELLGNIFSINDRGETKKEKAKSFLNNYLKDAPRPQSMVMENLKSAGISQRTAENAKAELGIRSFKEGAVWYWKMP